MKNASEQARRISVRLSPQLKATIERAAASRGQSLNQFLVATLAEGANEVLKSEVLKSEVLKSEVLKSEVLKSAVLKSEVLKSEVLEISGMLEDCGAAREPGRLGQAEPAKRHRPSEQVGQPAPALQPPVIISLEPYSGSRIFA